MSGNVHAFVFMKPLAASKTRLAGVLDDARRESFAAALLDATLSAIRSAQGLADRSVVGGDETVRRMTKAAGVSWLGEPGDGLNQSVAVSLAQPGGGYFLYLPADLPLLTADDIAALVAEAAPGRMVLAPDRRGRGTNALVLPAGCGFVPALGLDSYERHVAEASRLGLEVRRVETPGLGLDVDEPADLEALLSLAPRWRDVIGGSPVAQGLVE